MITISDVKVVGRSGNNVNIDMQISIGKEQLYELSRGLKEFSPTFSNFGDQILGGI